MNTYKLYIGRLNVVKGINYPKSNNGKMPIVNVHDIKIESNFSKFVLVIQLLLLNIILLFSSDEVTLLIK